MPYDLAASAGGAPFTQVVIVFSVSMLMFAAVGLVIWREAFGTGSFVGRIADRLAERTGAPRWAALPALLHLQSIVLAGIGVYWDVPYHYDFGRDEGPLANPAHYFIFFGLLGMMATGGIALALARKPLPRRALRLGRAWRVPYGAAAIVIGAVFGFVAFPMDDLWHRMFGQDVTLWGPTHILLLGGALFALIGAWLLSAEAQQVAGRVRFLVAYELGAAAWVALCLSAYLMEYDLGGPQFPLIAEPLLLTAFASVTLVAARARLPRGSLLVLFAVYAGLRLVIGEYDHLLGSSVPHIPLMLGSVLIVEAVALVVGPARRTAFAVVSGLLIGTLGVLAEFGWSHLAMVIAWPSGLLRLALPLSAVVGVAGALAGGWLSARLDTVAPGPAAAATVTTAATCATSKARAVPSAPVAAVALAVVFAVCGWAIPPTATTHGSATLSLRDVGTGTQRMVDITVRLHPANLADNATWLTAFSWQGGAIVRADLRPAGAGVYRATRPLPASGPKWKTLVRLHRGPKDLVAVPVYLPADPDIPAPAIAARDGVTRQFVAERQLLRRETRLDVPGWMWTAGYLAVALVFALMLGSTLVMLARASRTGQRRPAGGPVPVAPSEGSRA